LTISTNKQRSNYYYRKEQEARLLIRQRTEDLFERARRSVDLRIWSYPKHMRSHYESIVRQMFRDMCDEDLERKKLIDNQQLFLRLAQAYAVRHQADLELEAAGV
jgi:hypothetical protein